MHAKKVIILKQLLKYLVCLCVAVLVGCPGETRTAQNTSYIYPPWKHTWGVRRATTFKLRVFLGNKTKFNNPQGVACVRLDAWEDSTVTGDDDEVTVYGVNSGDNCIIYNKSMYSLDIYGLEKNHEKLNNPWGIAADRHGNVYVADRGNSRVVRLFNPGDTLQYIASLGGFGDGVGMFIDPRGVALDTRGRVYVTDAELGRITVFDDSGQVVDSWQGFLEPDGIAVIGPDEPWVFHRGDEFIIVVDSLHQRIRKLSLDGRLEAEVNAASIPGDGNYFGMPEIDYHSQVLITDKNNGCIHKFDRKMNYITKFGKTGSGDYEFDEPRGISIYRRLGQLFIAERGGAQYLWVAVDVPEFSAKVRSDSVWHDLDVDFFLSEPAFCTLELFDSYGRFLTRIVNKRLFQTGKQHLAWQMKIPTSVTGDKPSTELPAGFSQGELLPNGNYELRGKFRAMYSSREHYEREVTAKFSFNQ